MSEPIKTKLGEISNAPTPQNTPASVTGSYLKSNPAPTIPTTISEENTEELHKQLMANPALLAMIQDKLGGLVGKDSGYVDKLPKVIKKRVYGLKSIQEKQLKIEAEFQAELLELEKKYHTKYEPLFSRRHDIITGAIEPSSEEVEEGESLLKDDEEDDKIEEIKEEDEEDEEDPESEEKFIKFKGIPNFWLTALNNITPVADIITERDTEVLGHLVDVRMEYLDTPGFKLIFEFSENKFFDNKFLTKSYYYQNELGYSGDFIYDHAEGCAINWKSNDDNVTVHIERRKQRNKHTKQVRTIEKVVPTDSFFNFFDPPKAPKPKTDEDTPDVEDAEEESEEEEEDDDLEMRLEMDYQLGELFKDKLIPRAVDWFTGQALEYELDGADEYDSEDEEGFDDSEEESDEDDDSDEEDSDEETDKPKSQPAECNQT